jgi:hypothetical protein
MHLNWDDGAVVWLNGQVIVDHKQYPEKGHGMVFKDRYDFEETVPVTIPKGENTLAITSVNSKGRWGVNIRFTDENGWPVEGLHFGLPEAR